MYPRRQRREGFALVLLLSQLMQVGFDRIPPVTLVTLLGQVAIYLRLIPLPRIREVCVSGGNVWFKQDYKRLLTATFFHADEWHLYFNMVSFLYKGIKLEKKLGSKRFFTMVALFSVLTNVVLVGLSLVAEEATNDYFYINQCAVGFSGVLFALKVVLSSMSPEGRELLLGFIPVPGRYACWAELVLIHFMVPNSSFMGHLAGIIVGFAYTLGPLKIVTDIVTGFLGAALPTNRRESQRQQFATDDRSYTYHTGSTGGRVPPTGRRSRGLLGTIFSFFSNGIQRDSYPDNRPGPSGGHNTNYNPGPPPPGFRPETYTNGLSEEEQLAQAMRQSQRDHEENAERQRMEAEMRREYRAAPSAPPMGEDMHQYPGGAPTNPPYPTLPHQGDMPTAPPPAYGNLYPDLQHEQENLRNEEIRQRRLQRLEKSLR